MRRTGDRLQVNAGDAGGDVQPGLALHADRLQGIGIARTANQKVAAETDADRCVGADAAVAARERAASQSVLGALTAQENWVCWVKPRSTPMRRTVAI